MTIEVITSLSELDSATPEDKSSKIFMFADIENGQFTYYQWDDVKESWTKLSDSVNGSYMEDNQFIKAVTDSNDQIIMGIEKDGNVRFAQLPKQIVDYVSQTASYPTESREFAYLIIDAEDSILFKIYK